MEIENIQDSCFEWSREDVNRIISDFILEPDDSESWIKFADSLNPEDKEYILEDVVNDKAQKITSIINEALLEHIISCKEEFDKKNKKL